MYRAIGFVIIFLLAAGTSNSQELGMSVFGGYSVPGDSRVFGDLIPSKDGGASGHINFDRTQAGVVFGGCFFLREDSMDLGLSACNFYSERVSGALLSTKARTANVKAIEFERILRTTLLFFRYRYVSGYPVAPYLGVGMGIYGLWETPSGKNAIRELGPVYQGVAGIGAQIERRLPEIFAELRLNIAELNDDPSPGHMAVATLTIAFGLRFAH